MISVLLIGAIPPPIGGVSIHLDRLLKKGSTNISLALMDIKKQAFIHDGGHLTPLESIRFLINAKIIHLHLSTRIKIFIAIFSKALRKKVIYTHHNNIISKLEKKIYFKLFDHIVFVNDDCLGRKFNVI